MNAEDREYLRRVREAEVTPEEFKHMAHLRFAFLCLQDQGPERAAESVCAGIRNLAELWSVSEKFHRTITQALVILIHLRVGNEPSWEQARPKLGLLETDAMGLLERYYSKERLWSDDARTRFVEPDLADFGTAPTPRPSS